jgi:hypothetical protein
MKFDKASMQAFVFPPKCGSQTAMRFLVNCGWKSTHQAHSTPEFLINKYPNLQNYRLYAFFRNPLARFESAILYSKQAGLYRKAMDQFLIDQGIQKTRETVSYDELIDVFPAFKEVGGVILKPQSEWYQVPNITPLDFDNYEAELRRVTGNTELPLEIRNRSTDFGRSVITDKVRTFVREYYAADYALAKDRLGKTYEG